MEYGIKELETIGKALESELVLSIAKEGNKSLSSTGYLGSRIYAFFELLCKKVPNASGFVTASMRQLQESTYDIQRASNTIHFIVEILRMEQDAQTKVAEFEVFESAEVKIHEAARVYAADNPKAVLDNLNSALELILKSKLGIPSTIRRIDTGKIIDVCISDRIGPSEHLKEAKRLVLDVDNKVKHQGYVPNKIDCINALKIMEELSAELNKLEIKLEEDVKNKIYGSI